MPEAEPLAEVPESKSGVEALPTDNIVLARKLGGILAKKHSDSWAMLAQVDPEAAFAIAGEDPDKTLQVIADACMAPTGSEAHRIGTALLPQALKYCARNATKHGTDKWLNKLEHTQQITAAALPGSLALKDSHDHKIFELRSKRGPPNVDGLTQSSTFFTYLKQLTETEAYELCRQNIKGITDAGGYFFFDTPQYSPGEVGVYRFLRTQKQWNIQRSQVGLIEFFRRQNNAMQQKAFRQRMIVFPECRAAMATAFGITDRATLSNNDLLLKIEKKISGRKHYLLEIAEATFGRQDWYPALRDVVEEGGIFDEWPLTRPYLGSVIPPISRQQCIDDIAKFFTLLRKNSANLKYSILLAELLIHTTRLTDASRSILYRLKQGDIHPEAFRRLNKALNIDHKQFLTVEKQPMPKTTEFQSLEKKIDGTALIAVWRNGRAQLIQAGQATTELDELLVTALQDWQVATEHADAVRHIYAELAPPPEDKKSDQEQHLSAMLRQGVHRKMRARGAATVAVPATDPQALIKKATQILKDHTPSIADAQISRLRRHPKKTLTALLAAGALGATVEWYDDVKAGVRGVREAIGWLLPSAPETDKPKTSTPPGLPSNHTKPENDELPSKLGNNALAPKEGNESSRLVLRLSEKLEGRDAYLITACLADTTAISTDLSWHYLLSGGIEHPPKRSMTMQLELGKKDQTIPIPPHTFIFEKNGSAGAAHPQKLSSDAPLQINVGFSSFQKKVDSTKTIDEVRAAAAKRNLSQAPAKFDFDTFTILAPDLARAVTEAKRMPAAEAVEHVRQAVRKYIIYQSAPELMQGNLNPTDRLKQILQLRKGVCVQSTMVLDEALAHLGVPRCSIVCLKAENTTEVTRKNQHACNGALLLDTNGHPYLEIIDATGSAAESEEKLIQQDLAALKQAIEDREKKLRNPPLPQEHPIDPLTLMAIALALSGTRIGRAVLRRYFPTLPESEIIPDEEHASEDTDTETKEVPKKSPPEPPVNWQQIPEPIAPKTPLTPTKIAPVEVETYLPEPDPESATEVLVRLRAIFSEVFASAVHAETPAHDVMAFGKVADTSTARFNGIGQQFCQQNFLQEPIYTQFGGWAFGAWLGTMIGKPDLRLRWFALQQKACAENPYRAICVRRILEYCLQNRDAILKDIQIDLGNAPGDEAPVRLYQDDSTENTERGIQFFGWLEEALNTIPPPRKQNPTRIHSRTLREALQWTSAEELPKNQPEPA